MRSQRRLDDGAESESRKLAFSTPVHHPSFAQGWGIGSNLGIQERMGLGVRFDGAKRDYVLSSRRPILWVILSQLKSKPRVEKTAFPGICPDAVVKHTVAPGSPRTAVANDPLATPKTQRSCVRTTSHGRRDAST
jgi:hypothetical protein